MTDLTVLDLPSVSVAILVPSGLEASVVSSAIKASYLATKVTITDAEGSVVASPAVPEVVLQFIETPLENGMPAG